MDGGCGRLGTVNYTGGDLAWIRMGAVGASCLMLPRSFPDLSPALCQLWGPDTPWCWVPISSWEPWTELPYCCPSLFHVGVGFLSPVLLFISCWWRAAFAHLCATGELWWHCRVVTWSLPPPGSSGKGRAEPPWDKFILQPFSSSSRSILCIFLIRLWGNLRAATTRCSLIFQPKFSVTRQERFRKVAHGGTCKLLWFITI